MRRNMGSRDEKFRELVEQKKAQIPEDIGEFHKFLDYTSENGPDAVEEEPPRHGIRKLKGTPIWTLIYPVRMVYRMLRYLKQNGTGEIISRIKRLFTDNKWIRQRAARAYVASILPDEAERKRQREASFSRHITFSVLVPLYNTPERFLRDMIESVLNQTYQDWELCLGDASDREHRNVEKIVLEYANKDSRIVYRRLEKNWGIADNTNACIKMAGGTYLSLFDHDDVLHPSALYECAKVIEETGAEFIYTDEATFEGEEMDHIITYHFKPDFAPDNLRGVNYICHLTSFKKELLIKTGMFSKDYDGSQDHDIILKLTDAAARVAHIPKILYFWRCHSQSTSLNLDAKSYAVDAGRRAVRDAELRRGYRARVHSAQICRTHYRMEYETGDLPVHIFIEAREGEEEKAAFTAASIEKRSTWERYRITVLKAKEQLERELLRAAEQYVVLLNPGIEIITPNWIEELIMFAQRGDVGAVGMQVLDEKNLVLSSDLVMGTSQEGLVHEVNRGLRYDSPQYMGRMYYAHDVSAVSGGAVMGKREAFAKYFSEENGFTTYAGRMVDYCLGRGAEGKLTVLNPYALCKINRKDWHGTVTREEEGKLYRKYQELLKKGDPFYNPNLSLVQYWQKRRG